MAVYHIANDAHCEDLKILLHADVVAVVIKISGEEETFPYRSRPVLIQLASDKDTFILEPSKLDVATGMGDLMRSEKVLKVFRRAKTPVKHLLHHYKIATRSIFCSGLASQLLTMGNRVEKQELAMRLEPLRDRLKIIDQTNYDPRAPLNVESLQLVSEEVGILLQLHELLAGGLAQHKLKRVSNLEFRTVLPVAALELIGIYADKSRLHDVRIQIERDMDAIQSELLKELHSSGSLPGVEILNLNSPEQVKQALHSRGIPVQDTAESRLKPFVKQYPFIGQLLEYRHLGRLHSAVTSQLANSIAPETGRIHATYHQIASPSGRFACSNPNIQQIPRAGYVRGCVRPQEGYRFVIADYSQVELRVAAGLARDPLMLKAYAKGEDLHRLTAGLSMGKPPEAVTKTERQAAKAINFGLIYAMGARGLQQSAQASYGVKMSEDEAKIFRHRFFENYSGIQRWQRDTEQFGRKNGYVRTAAGRIRSYRDEPLRVTELLNIPVQGTAAEGLKSALCIFWDRAQEAQLKANIVAIIHDEIIVEVRTDQAERAKHILERAMVEGLEWLVPNVPFTVDAVIAESWAEK